MDLKRDLHKKNFQVRVQVRVQRFQVQVRVLLDQVQVQQKWTRVRTRVKVRTRVLQVWFLTQFYLFKAVSVDSSPNSI